MDSFVEIIRVPKIKVTLENLVLSGQTCKMEISRTPYSWLTSLSEIKEDGEGILLLVDGVWDFEEILSASHRQEVLVEYLEDDEVPCSFLARVSQVNSRGIWVEIINLVIPTYTDNMEMIKQMCGWIVEKLGPDYPLHFSRFVPQYKLVHLPPTPVDVLEQAKSLSNVRRILLAHGGRTGVESEKGKGSTFFMELPALRE